MIQNWFYLIELASDMSKIKLLFIIYACCLNKTTKTVNELTNEQLRSHFFLTDHLSCFSCEVIARERLSLKEHSVRTVLLGILRVKGCNEKAFNSSSDIFLVYGGS